MKLSVVIPTHNAARYLGQCLASIARQNYPATEVIIVDNLSNDDTLRIAESYRDIVRTIISEADSGQPEAVTKGLKMASGDIVHWHAADDIVLPGAFRCVAEEFISNPGLDLIFSDGIAFDTRCVYAGDHVRWINFWTALLFAGRFQSDCTYWRGRITDQALPLDNSKPLNCDEDFFLRLWAGRSYKWLPDPLGAFRIRPGQLSSKLPKGTLEMDRRDTRLRIIRALNLTPDEVRRLKKRWRMRYLLGSCILPRARAATRFMVRKATLDYRRHQYAEWLFHDWLHHDPLTHE